MLNATFATHALVVVLNIFTVLTMSMIYYYGQLHIGHGLNETVRHVFRVLLALLPMHRVRL